MSKNDILDNAEKLKDTYNYVINALGSGPLDDSKLHEISQNYEKIRDSPLKSSPDFAKNYILPIFNACTISSSFKTLSKRFWIYLLEFSNAQTDIDNNEFIPLFSDFITADVDNYPQLIKQFEDFRSIETTRNNTFWWPLFQVSGVATDDHMQEVINALANFPFESLNCYNDRDYKTFVKLILENNNEKISDRLFQQIVYPVLKMQEMSQKKEYLSSTRYKFEAGNKENMDKLLRVIGSSFPSFKEKFYEYFASKVFVQKRTYSADEKKNPMSLKGNEEYAQKIARLRKLTRALYRVYGHEEATQIVSNTLATMNKKITRSFVIAIAFDVVSLVPEKEYINVARTLLKTTDFDEFSDGLISYIAVCFAPILLGIKRSDLEEWAKVTTAKNSRIKSSGTKAELCKNALDIFDDSAAFELFINSNISEFETFGKSHKEDSQLYGSRLRLNLHRAWADKSPEKVMEFVNLVFSCFPSSAVPTFVQTLTFIKKRFLISLKLSDNFLYETFFEKLLSIIENDSDSQEIAFRTAAMLLEATSPRKVTEDHRSRWASIISNLLSSSTYSLVEISITASQFALTRFYTSSLKIVNPLEQAISKICSSGKEEVVMKFIGILISIFTISNKFDEYKDLHDKVLDTISPITALFNDITVSTISTLFVEEMTNKEELSEKMKELVRNIFTTKNANPLALRLLAIFPHYYKKITALFKDFFQLMLKQIERTVIFVHEEALFRSVLDVIIETCIESNNATLFRSLMKSIYDQCDPNLHSSIEVATKRFIFRMNQDFYDLPYYQEERTAIATNGDDAILGLIYGNSQNEFKVSTKTGYASNTFDIRIEDNTPFLEKRSKPTNEAYKAERVDDDEENEFDKELSAMKKEFIDSKTAVGGSSADSIIKKFSVDIANNIEPVDSQNFTTTLDAINITNEEKEEIEKSEARIFNKNAATNSIVHSLFDETGGLRVAEPAQLIRLAERNSYNISPRECLRIGLVYVADGQTHQNDILRNSWTDPTVTPAFKSFVKSLGAFIDLADHNHFNGKLDPTSFSNGRYHCFFASESFEVMFHCAPLMPTDPNDKQQIYKKRHIGNDNVNVIWSENDCDYDPQTISSQFNDAHIIIYPIHGCTTLFKVSVYKKAPSLSFGPLFTETICSANSLPSLVRWTSIFSDRASRALTSLSITPSRVFQNAVNELTNEISAK